MEETRVKAISQMNSEIRKNTLFIYIAHQLREETFKHAPFNIRLTFGKTKPHAVSWNCNFVLLKICAMPISAYVTHIKAQAQRTKERTVQKAKMSSPEERREKNREWEDDKGSSSRKLRPIRETE
jgi:hypothetical protein